MFSRCTFARIPAYLLPSQSPYRSRISRTMASAVSSTAEPAVIPGLQAPHAEIAKTEKPAKAAKKKPVAPVSEYPLEVDCVARTWVSSCMFKFAPRSNQNQPSSTTDSSSGTSSNLNTTNLLLVPNLLCILNLSSYTPHSSQAPRRHHRHTSGWL